MTVAGKIPSYCINYVQELKITARFEFNLYLFSYDFIVTLLNDKSYSDSLIHLKQVVHEYMDYERV